MRAKKSKHAPTNPPPTIPKAGVTAEQAREYAIASQAYTIARQSALKQPPAPKKQMTVSAKQAPARTMNQSVPPAVKQSVPPAVKQSAQSTTPTKHPIAPANQIAKQASITVQDKTISASKPIAGFDVAKPANPPAPKVPRLEKYLELTLDFE
jgi:hypothetical protein